MVIMRTLYTTCPCGGPGRHLSQETRDLPSAPLVEGVQESRLDGRTRLQTAVVKEIVTVTPDVTVTDVKHVTAVAVTKDRLPDDGVEFILVVCPLAPNSIAGADVVTDALQHHLVAELRTA